MFDTSEIMVDLEPKTHEQLITELPVETCEAVQREINAGIRAKQRYTAIRPMLPGEAGMQGKCIGILGEGVQKRPTQCFKPATHVVYWLEPGVVGWPFHYCSEHLHQSPKE